MTINNDRPTIEYIIKKAKEKYPVSFQYKGRLTEEEITELEKECDVHCSSIYMDGSAYYHIRLKEQKNEKDKTRLSLL